MTFTAESPLRDAGPEESPQDDPGDDLQDEFLGALAALGGSAGNGRLRDPAQGEAGGYDFVNHAVLCGPADTRAAFTSYVRTGSIAPRVARVDGDPKELKLPRLPKFPCLPMVCK